MKKGKKPILLYVFMLILILIGSGCQPPAGSPDPENEPAGEAVWALFPDVNLRGLVRQKFTDPGQVKLSELAAITELEAGDFNSLHPISSLAGIENLTGLKTLNLSGNPVTDISLLGHLTALTELDLSTTNITATGGTNIDPLAALASLRRLSIRNVADLKTDILADLTKLQKLFLSGTGLTDVGFLAGLTDLTELDLSACSITALQANAVLSDLINLQKLTLAGAGLTDDIETDPADISFLTALTNLTELNLSGCALSDQQADDILAGFVKLQKLILTFTGLTAIDFVTGLTDLNEFDVSFCNVRGLQPLLVNTGIGAGDTITITDASVIFSSEEIESLAVAYTNYLTDIYQLEAKGVTVITQ